MFVEEFVKFLHRQLQLNSGFFAGALQQGRICHRHHYVKAQVRVHEYPDGHLAVFHGPRCLARYRADGETIDDDDRLQAA